MKHDWTDEDAQRSHEVQRFDQGDHGRTVGPSISDEQTCRASSIKHDLRLLEKCGSGIRVRVGNEVPA